MKEVTVSTRDGFLNDGLLRKLKVEKSKQGERRKPVREKRKRIVFGEGIQCFSFAKGGTNSPVTCISQKLTQSYIFAKSGKGVLFRHVVAIGEAKFF
jgi:hypothetical protein